MPSPFPGMDPYLEAPNIWEDFHTNLATTIQAQLTPHLRPRYVAVLTPHVAYEELVIQETRVAKPDVGILKVAERRWTGEAAMIIPAPLIGHVALEVPIKLQSIEIHEVKTGALITAIEILSPVNKRPGHEAFQTYLRKRRDLLRTDVHLLEIDLLRGGRRPPLVTSLPDASYFIFLSRGEQRPKVEIWPLSLREPLPILPVPLSTPDPDVPLDLGKAIQTIYNQAAYDLRLDYTQPPPKPDLSLEDARWLEAHLQSAGVR